MCILYADGLFTSAMWLTMVMIFVTVTFHVCFNVCVCLCWECSGTAGLRQSEGTQPVTNSQHCCQPCDMGTTRPALNHVSNRPSLVEVPDTTNSSNPSRCENHMKKTRDQNSQYGRTQRYRPSECSTAGPSQSTVRPWVFWHFALMQLCRRWWQR